MYPEPSATAASVIEHFNADSSLNRNGEIQYLALQFAKIDEAGIRLLATCPALIDIYLQGNELDDRMLGLLIEAVPKLERLDIRSCVNLTNSAIQSVARLNHLRELELYGTAIDDSGVVSLASLKSIECLNLSGLAITDEAVAVLKSFEKLHHLYLEDCPSLTDRGLDSVRSLPGLQWLGLRQSPFTDRGLVALGSMTKLQRLYLSGPTIVGPGLAHLALCQNLSGLILDRCAIDDVGISNLPPLRKLKELSLVDTRITDAAADHLRTFKGLRQLCLESTRFSKEGKVELKKHLPRCAIYVDSVEISSGEAIGIEYFRTNPPRCLKGFRCEPNQQVAAEAVEFHVFCSCGETALEVHGYSLRSLQPDYGGDLFVGPLGATCSSCGKKTTIFDSDIHGYDGELGQSSYLRGKGKRQRFVCPKCGGTHFSLLVTFGYDGGEKDLLEDDPDIAVQDFFGSFAMLGTCRGCKSKSWIAAFETA